MRRFSWLCLVFCVPVAPAVWAQDAELSGLVRDSSAAAIPNATLKIVSQETGTSRTTKTNDSGLYSFPALKPGTYDVDVSAEGFKKLTRSDLKLEVDQRALVDFALEVGSVQETITVTAGTEMLNATDASVGTVVDRQFVENIPLNGRTFQSLIALTPGVVSVPGAATGNKGEFSVNGQRTEASYYTVDGAAANTGSLASSQALGASGNLPAETALGTTQSLVSLDALQEFRIQTSTYSAEYGRTPGGQISFVTRSGTNDWHGSAFNYLRNGVFDANNWFNNAGRLPKTSERQNDFGGTFSGPVLLPRFGEGGRQPWYNGHNRTFFFFSYEGLRLSTPVPAQTTFAPDLSMRQNAPAALKPILNAFPVSNGPDNAIAGMAQFTAAFSIPGTLNATSIRIDHSFNDKFTVFGRYSDSPSQTVTRGGGGGINSLANPITTSTAVRTFTIGATNLFTSRLVNQFRFNYTQNDGRSQATLDNFGGAVPFSVNNINDATGQPTPGVVSFNFQLLFGGNASLQLFDLKLAQRQANFIDTLGYSLGPHSFKFGVDYRRLATPLTLSSKGETGRFTSLAQIQQNLATPGSQVFSQASFPTGPVYENLSIFAQDEWKTTPRLSLSLGLRWELNPPPTDAYGNPPYTLDQITNLAMSQLAPKGTPLWRTTYANFAPRVGGAYQLRRSLGWETVIRGGFGVFYDMGNTRASQGYAGVGNTSLSNLSNVPFPFTAAQLTLPLPNVAPPYNATVFAFDPNLQLPYTLEWNAAVEQALGKSQTLTVSYVGASARRLLWQRTVRPAVVGNANFTSAGALNITTNRATSDYDALQVQFQRRLNHGLQVLSSYTWSHSIDETSANSGSLELLRSSSDFDIRHNFQTALTYDIPGKHENPLVAAILSHWSLDTKLTGLSGLPFDVSGGTFFDATGTQQQLRADLVLGQPIYINDPTAPGGRRVNFDAFTIPTAAELAALQFGNAPRNFLRAFPAWQVDFSVRREFPLHERLKLQFRAEAFNLLNHPIFGAVRNTLTSGSALFGRATGTLNNQLGGLNALYQVGGPRSFQFALKLVF